jgi:4a-hydroxytetrahydrobiopterin dehydratase
MSFKVRTPKTQALTKLGSAQVDAKLKALTGWKREGDFITKSFKFKEFMDGIGFVHKVALIAEKLGHHPDIHIVWTTVTLQIQTHDEGGLTSLDFKLAGQIEKGLGQKKPKVAKK